MDDHAITLDVSILGRPYRVACKESERMELLQAVQFLDNRMREIRDASKISGAERIAVMAALNIAHELQRGKPGAVKASVAVAVDASSIERRVLAMQSAIDRAMADQDKLL